MKAKEYLPILQWLPFYSKVNFRMDLLAGITIGVMVIPQGMAYGMLAGLPPIYGLYACLIPTLIYALMGTSRHLVIGPAAMISILTATSIGQFAELTTPKFVGLALVLAFMVGVIQLILGMLKLGFLVRFISNPVISGFTSAVSIIIFFSQLKYLIGVDIDRSPFIHEIIPNALSSFYQWNWWTILIGICGVIIIKSTKKINKKIPAALIAVVLGTLAVYLFSMPNLGVDVVGKVPEGLPQFVLPDFQLSIFQDLLPSALTLALIGILTAIANAKAILIFTKEYEIDPNQEIRALGMSNLLGAFFQAYPTSGSFSRTIVNYQSGAKTTISGIVAASIVALTLFFLTPLFYYLPKAILASIIMVAVIRLIDYEEAITLWKTDKSDFIMLIVTFLSTLFLGIELGILIGVSLSLIWVIYKTTKPDMGELGRIPKTNHFEDIRRFSNLEIRDDILIIQFDREMYYANAPHFKESLKRLVKKKGKYLKVIILDSRGITALDSSAANTLKDVMAEYQSKKINFWMVHVTGSVRDTMYKNGLWDENQDYPIFLTVQDAIDFYEKGSKNAFKEYTFQTNVTKTK
jgi:SulP family sulfate permease